MPSRAWVVTEWMEKTAKAKTFQCPLGLELLQKFQGFAKTLSDVSMPSRAWVVTCRLISDLVLPMFQCPLGLELLLVSFGAIGEIKLFQCPHGLELLRIYNGRTCIRGNVSMPSRAWVVTSKLPWHQSGYRVSMPSRAWVVTSKNIQYFKFFMILFIHTCYL